MPAEANMLSKVGITKISSTAMATMATVMMTPG